MNTWVETIKVLFNGPGWHPGTPRLGDPSASSDVQANRAKYDPRLPIWQEVYVVLQYFLALFLQQVLIAKLSVSMYICTISMVRNEFGLVRMLIQN